jgi:hypothetical protein
MSQGEQLMPRNRTSKSREAGFVIDIKGVTAATPLGTLTVGQFVELLVQLAPQLRTALRAQQQPEVMKHVLEQIRKIMEESGDNANSNIGGKLRSVQLAVLDQMPELMRRAMSPADRGNKK